MSTFRHKIPLGVPRLPGLVEPVPSLSRSNGESAVRLWFLRVAAFLMLFLASQAIFGLLNPQASEISLDVSTDVSPAMAIISSAIYGIALLSLLPYWRLLPSMLLNAKGVLALPVLAVISIAWSQDPSLTLRRSVVLLTVSCIGVCFGSIFSLQELSKLVTITALCICLASFGVALVSPHIVIDPLRPGVWRGIFTQKNVLGTFMVLGLISALHSRFTRRPLIRYATLAMAAVLLLLSRSSTSLITIIAILIMLPLWRLGALSLKRVVVVFVPLICLIGLAVFFFVHYSHDIFSTLGKSATLTGRTDLWPLVIEAILRRPLIGYGYSAFWLGLQGASLSITVAAGWYVPHAHNGLLDIFLGVGSVGAVLFLATFIHFSSMLVARLRAARTGLDQLWPASFLLLLTIVNATESLLMSPNSIFWLLYVAIYANLARQTAYENTVRTPQALINQAAMRPRFVPSATP